VLPVNHHRLCCCHRDETGTLLGDEGGRSHGGVSVAKRSESPNSFLDQESHRREEEEPVYCTTPTYGTLSVSAQIRLRLGFTSMIVANSCDPNSPNNFRAS